MHGVCKWTATGLAEHSVAGSLGLTIVPKFYGAGVKKARIEPPMGFAVGISPWFEKLVSSTMRWKRSSSPARLCTVRSSSRA